MMVQIVTIMLAKEYIMADKVTLSIKTDPDTKALIQQAAANIGLSVNSFVLMVAKNAAESSEIVISNATPWEREEIAKWEASDQKSISSEEFDKMFGF
jgi:antitoxin component of RelBE/YafQ-DinJ toxin-antitoxin module